MPGQVPERQGQPIVGVDLGGGRAWSAAVALYPNGRVECKAVAPGIPDLDELKSNVTVCRPIHTGKLFDLGQLDVAEGLTSATSGAAMGYDSGNLGEAATDCAVTAFDYMSWKTP